LVPAVSNKRGAEIYKYNFAVIMLLQLCCYTAAAFVLNETKAMAPKASSSVPHHTFTNVIIYEITQLYLHHLLRQKTKQKKKENTKFT
jgi:hypothetical protein